MGANPKNSSVPRTTMQMLKAAQDAVNQILAESSSLAEAAPKFIETVCQFALWDVGAIWLLDRDLKILNCAHFYQTDGVNVPAFKYATLNRTFRVGQGLPGRAWLSRKTAWVGDIAIDTNYPRSTAASRDDIHTGCAFPVLLDGKIAAVFEFFTLQVRDQDKEQLAMFTGFSEQMARFIENNQMEAVDDALKVMRCRQQFLSTLCYDLKKPLLGADRLLELFIQGTLGPLSEQQITLLTQLKSSNMSVVETVNELGAICVLERGRLNRPLAANLTPLLEETVLSVQNHEMNGKTISLQADADAYIADMDCLLLQRALTYLLEYSMHMTPADSAVCVRLISEPEHAKLSIKVGGLKTDEEELQHMFDRASRGIASTLVPPAFGHKLHLCKMIIEAHKGSLTAIGQKRSEAGIRFEVVLPAVPA